MRVIFIICIEWGSNPRILTILGLKSNALDHSAIRASIWFLTCCEFLVKRLNCCYEPFLHPPLRTTEKIAHTGNRTQPNFFIIRFDVGLKVRDPQFEEDNRWVLQDLFYPAWKAEYFESHNAQNYHFLSYNIGIGYPF